MANAIISRYTKTAVVLHWLIAALLIAEFAHGWWMQTIPKEPVGIRADAFNLHKSVGLLLLALVLLRLGWRIAHRPPALPVMPRWQLIAARANHLLLYAMMLAMPIAGYIGSVASGYPIKWFGVTLPAWGIPDPALKTWMSVVHLVASWILLAATCAHVAGTIKHTLGGDHVMARMGIGSVAPVAPTRVAMSDERGTRVSGAPAAATRPSPRA